MKKAKLNPIYLQGLHHAEFGQFIDRFINDFSEANLNLNTDTDFKTLFDDLKSKVPAHNKSLMQIRENENTKKIAELDKERDNDFQALKDSIKPYRNSKKDQQIKAYNTLKILLDEYKNIATLSYEEETKKISSLLSSLKNSDYQPHITTLKIEEFISELEKSNTAFNTLFGERSAQNIGKESYDTKALRKEITDIYRKLTNYIIALVEIKTDPFYRKTLEVINNSRKYYADTLAKRNGQKIEKKENE